VYCDRARIRQVVLNLVTNAARFTDTGGITVAVTVDKGRACVEVADTGSGIAAEDVERIFEPFHQAIHGVWHDQGGSGLGLSISQQFIKSHQGRMWVESTPGAGSTFAFDLPISPPVAVEALPGRWIRSDWVWREDSFHTSQTGAADETRKPAFVVCDENGGLAVELSRFSDEIDVVVARDRAEALRIACKTPVDAVIVNAGKTDDSLRASTCLMGAGVAVPVILCGVPESARRAQDAGAIDYIVKPVSGHDLEQAMHHLGTPVTEVLVIDDDGDVRDLLTRMLYVIDDSMRVDTAGCGSQGLEKMQAKRYDMVLLDVILPDMDGWQVMARLKTNDVHKQRVFFVSAQDPVDQPPTSPELLVTLDSGFSVSKLLRCSIEISRALQSPDEAPGSASQRTIEAVPAWTGNVQRPAPAPDPLL